MVPIVVLLAVGGGLREAVQHVAEPYLHLAVDKVRLVGRDNLPHLLRVEYLRGDKGVPALHLPLVHNLRF